MDKQAKTRVLEGMWNMLESTVFLILDENGENIANAQVRHWREERWIYVDDQNGYENISTEDLTFLGGMYLIIPICACACGEPLKDITFGNMPPQYKCPFCGREQTFKRGDVR